MLTRRCFQRRLFLAPSPQINQLMSYCIGVAAQRSGILMHALMVMGNHYHPVVTDPERTLPEFMHDANMLIAKRLNAHYGRSESFWKPGSYSAVELVEREDVLAKIVYALQNPVAAGLVANYEQWPGLFSRPREMLGGSRIIERPSAFFGAKSSLPEVVELRFSPPPNVGPAERFVEDVEDALAAVEEQHRQRMRESGGRFMGRRRVMAQRHSEQPGSDESKSAINPRIACKDKRRRVEALRELRAFYVAHEEARLRFKSGGGPVEFPAGTYWWVENVGEAFSADTS
jgi:putative transposase